LVFLFLLCSMLHYDPSVCDFSVLFLVLRHRPFFLVNLLVPAGLISLCTV
jgi:hypothetical protein